MLSLYTGIILRLYNPPTETAQATVPPLHTYEPGRGHADEGTSPPPYWGRVRAEATEPAASEARDLYCSRGKSPGGFQQYCVHSALTSGRQVCILTEMLRPLIQIPALKS